MDTALEGGIFTWCHRHAVWVNGDDGALQTCGDKGTARLRGHSHHLSPLGILPHSVAALTVAGAVTGGDSDRDNDLAGDAAHVSLAHVLS